MAGIETDWGRGGGVLTFPGEQRPQANGANVVHAPLAQLDRAAAF